MPRMAFTDARILVFLGSDRQKFLDGLSSNKIEFESNGVVTTLFLDNKAKIVAQVHLFCLGELIIGITITEDSQSFLEYLNQKILGQEVAINDITSLNHIDIIYDEPNIVDGVVAQSNHTIIGMDRLYQFDIYPSKLPRENVSNDYQSFTEWRIINLIPWYGYEISSKVNPYQCGLNSHVHENKGCYTGQEILTRMRSRNKGMCELEVIDNLEIDKHNVTTKGIEQSIIIKRV